MQIYREPIGTTTGLAGQPPADVDAYTLDTGAGLATTVWTYGATVVEVRVPDRAGRAANVVLRLPDLDAYQDRSRNASYLGATLGRFGRCVAGARFQLDGREYRLDRNHGRHHFHGGTNGFDRYVWKADAGRDGDSLALKLDLHSRDGDQGYPGDLSATAVYRVDREGRLTLEYRATTTASTIVGLTSHAFWNLAGTGTIGGQRLALNAARVLPTDDELIPLGAPVDVAGTSLDYTAPRPIREDRLDHCFALDDPAWAAELHDPGTGRAMRVVTDQPGLAVYSGDGLREPRTGLCLQSGAWPDAPNHPSYPAVRLDPGTEYRHHVRYEFTLL
ncbi:MAG TPA: aldose epimerase family protein [Longimicrobium sp.]|nr:aldose epimerase family protein [Longimicrobium sp.]